MTTVTTLTTAPALDGKSPAVYHEAVLIEHIVKKRQTQTQTQTQTQIRTQPPDQPSSATQRALLVHGAQQPYALVTDHAIPSILHKDEILIKVTVIGLNPVDWKGPAYNFGLPRLPWVNGRDLAGVVVQASEPDTDTARPRLRKGDLVLVPSTDYRDIRKAAFQEYAVATHFNAARIPPTSSVHAAASAGVAFVAATLALGVSFGLDFGTVSGCPGPNLPDILRTVDVNTIPPDVRDECFASREEIERPKPGDWIAIWGASTTTGLIATQLAHNAGLRTICVADIARHGARLHAAGADILVDRHDTARAVQIIRGVTGGKLRFALDIVGSQTAAFLQEALDTRVAGNGSHAHAHLLGLTGLPDDRDRDGRIIYHTVPIKLFHSSPEVGGAMVTWLERLMESGTLQLPEVIRAEGGLGGINAALEMLRRGEASGKRIVVSLH
ncbi:zinc-binding alcohol dehydrogenase family protein [Aspergillus lucknowensis]|uniref:Chaperonin 10-like protein n=1 Tax=Aspergillus lucknowensis TaxID=176173 RepID=A0ABR4LS50_9EURO